ncbi:MAG: recombination mediator RecR [Bacteroidales bacterium]|nr:recombination mediator RecR [Bacteroidales bacterium]MDD4574961.1 recombination mediator RecR [Bacteroidales bacterium]
MNTLSSKILQNAVNEISRLPGIGKRTALRLALSILKYSNDEMDDFVKAFVSLKNDIYFCKLCHNISDTEICPICQDSRRDKSIVCVVQDIRDIIAIENTRQYRGVYHVLGGIISPMDGVGPDDLNFKSLFERIQNMDIQEVVLALPTTIEGDTTNYYIYKNMESSNVHVSIIARGIAVGDELEYADEVTLGRSLINRVDFEQLSVK